MIQDVCLQSEPNADTEIRTQDFHTSGVTSGYH